MSSVQFAGQFRIWFSWPESATQAVSIRRKIDVLARYAVQRSDMLVIVRIGGFITDAASLPVMRIRFMCDVKRRIAVGSGLGRTKYFADACH